jgi:hypothetical protein
MPTAVSAISIRASVISCSSSRLLVMLSLGRRPLKPFEAFREVLSLPRLANALSRSIFSGRSVPHSSISFIFHGPSPFVSHVPFAPHNRHSYSPQRYNPHLLQLFRRQRERHFTAQQSGRRKRDIYEQRSVSIPFFPSAVGLTEHVDFSLCLLIEDSGRGEDVSDDAEDHDLNNRLFEESASWDK